MICLYAADESLFEHNGLGILDNDLKKCHVEEELNNLYTLTAQYPLWAKFGKSIRNGMIIKAPTPNGDQLFRIYQSKPSMGMLEIHAFHIFYDLAFNFVEDTNIVSKSGQAWLQQLSQNTQYRHPFTFFSDISTVAGSRVVRKNCVEILLNTSLDNSFVNRFGGEILRDNFKVYFNRAIGENRGFKIRHKKNLKGYTANIDDKSVITRIMPIGFDGLLLPEKYVDSPRISDYPFPRIGKVEVDVKAAVGENADAKDAIPLNEAHAKMRSLVREQFGLIDVPNCSYEIDFVELSKTKEYADFQNLETVRIGDTVTVSHDEDGFYVEAKVIRYEYDSLAGSLLRIEAGQFESRSSNNSINQQRSIEQQLEDVKIETSNMVQVAANGKNTIYRGIDRPANANVGDLWYEPLENSVVLKQWSGVDWELIPISDQNLGNVNVNNLSGNYIDVRRFRISSGDRDILYVNEAGEVILNAKRVQIDFTDVATKDDLEKIELTPGPKGEKGDPGQRGSDGLPGRDGVGIRSTTVAYASSTNGATAPTTGWTAVVPTVAPGNYLWTKTVWTYTDGNTETGYTVSRIGRDGNTGRDGIAGKDGVGIHSTTITYGKSTSGTIQPTSWTSQVPSVPNGQFLWTKTVWAYTDNTSETGYSVAKMGETGPKGEQGIQGLSYHLFTTNYQYNQTSISQYSTPGYTGTWVVNEDTGLVKIGDTVSMSVYHTKKLGLVYILATVKAIASDRSLTTVSKGLIDKGEQGIPGEKGADGRTQYTHIAYADNATGGGFSQTDQTKAYIGMYQDFTAINSTNPTSYRWSKWKGSDGAQGIPGPKGADGRTPYIHWAYSDSADGTGLTTSDNGQRYIGHYSDYTQADSTDKTKYRWADRWAKIEVGGINLLTGTDEETVYISKDPAAMEFLRTPYDLAKVFDKHGLVTYTLSFDLKVDKDGAVHVYMQNGSGSKYSGLWKSLTVTTEWQRFHVTFTPTEGNMELSESFLAFYGVYGTGVVPHARKFKLEKGTVPTDWSLAIEDWQLELNSKADQAFTQEQLNLLNERAQILDAELKAKASMDALSDLEKAYQSFVKSNADSRAKSEADLADAGRRIDLLVTQFGGFKELKTFIDTYMSSSNEGLIIGKNDASSTIKVSSDRISMFSAGKEVMYISQGVIHIDNGIFTASVQIGRFRTEQYHLNADMNVIRYVG
ncbi:phage tail spike protein [Streptococcus suis]|uniref:Phage tail protein n=1 Tax=Streptococcus suis TaxID=1307 RepID=A0A7T1P5P6_STRSU|nr:phage tail spike protein [Streptococcus suis]QPO27019.1 phage tail protein [Streptococcus suis]HEL1642009.1 phage tail protein [Streptococcus suis]HEL1650682.1 phage tail protein [Streptococcus suis]HEL1656622.1 phage tail protein [Streptococcus suis]HEL1673152.1 phage tail protein [Streptococcus suis]